jgi:acyl-[acyl-carrier-protein]-phospholipid O-acyltransferase / long-chain-fatty-acid--[acyl-carrier-protein] ligase
MPQSQFSLFKTRRFWPLFATQFLAAMNDNVFRNALVVLMTYKLAQQWGLDARLLVTLAGGLFIVPFFLFSSLAGQLADKFEKTQLIRRLKLVEIFLMLLAAAAFYSAQLWALMGVLLLLGTQAAFFGPIKYSILPDLLAENELVAGNGLIEAGTFVAILLGTAIGGALILQPHGVALITAVFLSIAVACWVLSFLIPAVKVAAPNIQINYNLFTQSWQIVRQAYAERTVFLAVLGISWFWLVGFIFLAQIPILGKDILGGNEQVITLLTILFSVGVAVGALACHKLTKGYMSGRYVGVGAFGMSVACVVLWAISPAVVLANAPLLGVVSFVQQAQNWGPLLAMFLLSIFAGIFTVPLYALMQARANPAHRSRVVAANNILNALFMVVASFITLGLVQLGLSVPQMFLVLGLANVPVAYAAWRLLRD